MTGLRDLSAVAIDNDDYILYFVSYLMYIFITTSKQQSNYPLETHDSDIVLRSEKISETFLLIAWPKIVNILLQFTLLHRKIMLQKKKKI